MTHDLSACFALLDEAYDTHKPTHVFTLLSGGHDSTCATTVGQEWAAMRGIHVPVAYANTGTGIEERHVRDTGLKDTRTHVIDLCQLHEWSLIELHPPRSYQSLVREMGFPGPGFHDRLAYPRLKERSFRTLRRMAAGKDRVMFITGVRSEESVRRTAHVERIQETPGVIWAAAIWDWTKADCNAFIAERELPRNQISDVLHISGECLCGAMARPDERDELRRWLPLKYAEIVALEDEAEALGLRACRWGQRPPAVAREQMRAFLTPSDGSYPMACMGCAPDVAEEAA
jgi:3'-phosphoadenosine 5'-phosphosulfate sulfotransferase (PAPS reductase)/FAD synthetase